MRVRFSLRGMEAVSSSAGAEGGSERRSKFGCGEKDTKGEYWDCGCNVGGSEVWEECGSVCSIQQSCAVWTA